MSRRSTAFLTRIASILNPSEDVELPFSRNYKKNEKETNFYLKKKKVQKYGKAVKNSCVKDYARIIQVK